MRRIVLATGFLSVLSIVRADDSVPPAQSSPPAKEAEARETSEPVGTQADAPTGEKRFEPTSGEAALLDFLDRDGDGTLTSAEFERFPVPMRSWLAASKSAPAEVSVDEFGPTLRAMVADLRTGRHSRAFASRRPVAVGTVARAKAEPEVPKVDTSGSLGDEGRYSFGRMDQKPRDGKLSLEEWNGQTKKWMEDNGVKIPRSMDKETFVQHYVRLRM